MCFCFGFGPRLPMGIPIEDETHDLLPQEVKDAYEVFEKWWDTVHLYFGVCPVDESTMPEEVRTARELILKTPIPGYDNVTCADSCAMVLVQHCFDLYRRQSMIKD